MGQRAGELMSSAEDLEMGHRAARATATPVIAQHPKRHPPTSGGGCTGIARHPPRQERRDCPRTVAARAPVGHGGIGGAVDLQDGDRIGGSTGGQGAVAAGHRRHRGDAGAQVTGQAGGHSPAVGDPGGVHPLGVQAQGSLQAVKEIGDEPHVVESAMVLADRPVAVDPDIGIDGHEALAVGDRRVARVALKEGCILIGAVEGEEHGQGGAGRRRRNVDQGLSGAPATDHRDRVGPRGGGLATG